MDDPRVLRILTIGLVLAALAVGYFLLTGGLSVKSKKVQPQTTQVEVSPSPSAVAGVDYQPSPSSSPQSAYDRLASRSQSNVQTLPNTSFPTGAAAAFSLGALVTGWSLRKYPY